MSDIARGDELLDFSFKGFPVLPAGTTVSQFVAARPSLFDAGFSWPVATLQLPAIEHNISAFADWCSSHGVSLAPHGKTTMAPNLFERQLEAGAWAVTAATPWQVRVYRAAGIRRVLLANELVDATAAAWIGSELAADPDFEFFCYVDSVVGAALLGNALATTRCARAVGVLVEVGLLGGRTGCRSYEDVEAVANEVRKHQTLALVGVAGFEGPIGHGHDDVTISRVEDFARSLVTTLGRLDRAELLDRSTNEFLLTCGGSGHVEIVTSVLAEPVVCSRPVRVVLRSGAYVTHDNGLYAQSSFLARALKPAMEVWCQVLSRPEPDLVLLGAGRRDLSFDSGLPVVLRRRSLATGAITPCEATVTQLNDQHAFVHLEPSERLDVGDLVGLGISHPCTAHDKWRLLPLLDVEWRVVDCVRSYF